MFLKPPKTIHKLLCTVIAVVFLCQDLYMAAGLPRPVRHTAQTDNLCPWLGAQGVYAAGTTGVEPPNSLFGAVLRQTLARERSEKDNFEIMVSIIETGLRFPDRDLNDAARLIHEAGKALFAINDPETQKTGLLALSGMLVRVAPLFNGHDSSATILRELDFINEQIGVFGLDRPEQTRFDLDAARIRLRMGQTEQGLAQLGLVFKKIDLDRAGLGSAAGQTAPEDWIKTIESFLDCLADEPLVPAQQKAFWAAKISHMVYLPEIYEHPVSYCLIASRLLLLETGQETVSPEKQKALEAQTESLLGFIAETLTRKNLSQEQICGLINMSLKLSTGFLSGHSKNLNTAVTHVATECVGAGHIEVVTTLMEFAIRNKRSNLYLTAFESLKFMMSEGSVLSDDILQKINRVWIENAEHVGPDFIKTFTAFLSRLETSGPLSESTAKMLAGQRETVALYGSLLFSPDTESIRTGLALLQKDSVAPLAGTTDKMLTLLSLLKNNPRLRETLLGSFSSMLKDGLLPTEQAKEEAQTGQEKDQKTEKVRKPPVGIRLMRALATRLEKNGPLSGPKAALVSLLRADSFLRATILTLTSAVFLCVAIILGPAAISLNWLLIALTGMLSLEFALFGNTEPYQKIALIRNVFPFAVMRFLFPYVVGSFTIGSLLLGTGVFLPMILGVSALMFLKDIPVTAAKDAQGRWRPVMQDTAARFPIKIENFILFATVIILVISAGQMAAPLVLITATVVITAIALVFLSKQKSKLKHAAAMTGEYKTDYDMLNGRKTVSPINDSAWLELLSPKKEKSGKNKLKPKSVLNFVRKNVFNLVFIAALATLVILFVPSIWAFLFTAGGQTTMLASFFGKLLTVVLSGSLAYSVWARLRFAIKNFGIVRTNGKTSIGLFYHLKAWLLNLLGLGALVDKRVVPGLGAMETGAVSRRDKIVKYFQTKYADTKIDGKEISEYLNSLNLDDDQLRRLYLSERSASYKKMSALLKAPNKNHKHEGALRFFDVLLLLWRAVNWAATYLIRIGLGPLLARAAFGAHYWRADFLGTQIGTVIKEEVLRIETEKESSTGLDTLLTDMGINDDGQRKLWSRAVIRHSRQHPRFAASASGSGPLRLLAQTLTGLVRRTVNLVKDKRSGAPSLKALAAQYKARDNANSVALSRLMLYAEKLGSLSPNTSDTVKNSRLGLRARSFFIVRTVIDLVSGVTELFSTRLLPFIFAAAGSGIVAAAVAGTPAIKVIGLLVFGAVVISTVLFAVFSPAAKGANIFKRLRLSVKRHKVFFIWAGIGLCLFLGVGLFNLGGIMTLPSLSIVDIPLLGNIWQQLSLMPIDLSLASNGTTFVMSFFFTLFPFAAMAKRRKINERVARKDSLLFSQTDARHIRAALNKLETKISKSPTQDDFDSLVGIYSKLRTGTYETTSPELIVKTLELMDVYFRSVSDDDVLAAMETLEKTDMDKEFRSAAGQAAAAYTAGLMESVGSSRFLSQTLKTTARLWAAGFIVRFSSGAIAGAFDSELSEATGREQTPLASSMAKLSQTTNLPRAAISALDKATGLNLADSVFHLLGGDKDMSANEILETKTLELQLRDMALAIARPQAYLAIANYFATADDIEDFRFENFCAAMQNAGGFSVEQSRLLALKFLEEFNPLETIGDKDQPYDLRYAFALFCAGLEGEAADEAAEISVRYIEDLEDIETFVSDNTETPSRFLIYGDALYDMENEFDRIVLRAVYGLASARPETENEDIAQLEWLLENYDSGYTDVTEETLLNMSPLLDREQPYDLRYAFALLNIGLGGESSESSVHYIENLNDLEAIVSDNTQPPSRFFIYDDTLYDLENHFDRDVLRAVYDLTSTRPESEEIDQLTWLLKNYDISYYSEDLSASWSALSNIAPFLYSMSLNPNTSTTDLNIAFRDIAESVSSNTQTSSAAYADSSTRTITFNPFFVIAAIHEMHHIYEPSIGKNPELFERLELNAYTLLAQDPLLHEFFETVIVEDLGGSQIYRFNAYLGWRFEVEHFAEAGNIFFHHPDNYVTWMDTLDDLSEDAADEETSLHYAKMSESLQTLWDAYVEFHGAVFVHEEEKYIRVPVTGPVHEVFDSAEEEILWAQSITQGLDPAYAQLAAYAAGALFESVADEYPDMDADDLVNLCAEVVNARYVAFQEADETAGTTISMNDVMALDGDQLHEAAAPVIADLRGEDGTNELQALMEEINFYATSPEANLTNLAQSDPAGFRRIFGIISSGNLPDWFMDDLAACNVETQNNIVETMDEDNRDKFMQALSDIWTERATDIIDQAGQASEEELQNLSEKFPDVPYLELSSIIDSEQDAVSFIELAKANDVIMDNLLSWMNQDSDNARVLLETCFGMASASQLSVFSSVEMKGSDNDMERILNFEIDWRNVEKDPDMFFTILSSYCLEANLSDMAKAAIWNDVIEKYPDLVSTELELDTQFGFIQVFHYDSFFIDNYLSEEADDLLYKIYSTFIDYNVFQDQFIDSRSNYANGALRVFSGCGFNIDLYMDYFQENPKWIAELFFLPQNIVTALAEKEPEFVRQCYDEQTWEAVEALLDEASQIFSDSVISDTEKPVLDENTRQLLSLNYIPGTSLLENDEPAGVFLSLLAHAEDTDGTQNLAKSLTRWCKTSPGMLPALLEKLEGLDGNEYDSLREVTQNIADRHPELMPETETEETVSPATADRDIASLVLPGTKLDNKSQMPDTSAVSVPAPTAEEGTDAFALAVYARETTPGIIKDIENLRLKDDPADSFSVYILETAA